MKAVSYGSKVSRCTIITVFADWPKAVQNEPGKICHSLAVANRAGLDPQKCFCEMFKKCQSTKIASLEKLLLYSTHVIGKGVAELHGGTGSS